MLRIARTVGGKCYRGIAAFFKPTLHPAANTNYTDRSMLVQSTARCASSEAIQPHHVPPTVECTAGGRKLKVSWPDEVLNVFHSVWLRHSCTCPTCWDVLTNQKLVRPPDLIGDPTVHSIEVCESQDGTGSLRISWSYSNGSEHEGEIDLAWLRKNSYSLATIRERQQRSTPLATTAMPQLSCSEVLKGEEGVWKWMRHLNENGVCLLTDIPTQLGQIKKVTHKAKLIPREVFFGLLYDVISVDKPIDLAVTSAALPLHSDLPYFESPPGLQILHCIRNDACVEGGKSVLLDAFAVVEELREKHPQHFATLSRIPATFERTHPMKDNPVSFRYQRPHISVDRYSTKVTGIFWNPASEGPLFLPEEDVEAYYEAYLCLTMMFAASDLKIYHRLEPGEAITFNNRRFLHSRTAFKTNGGKRHLQGVYVNTEDFKSRVRILASQFSPGYEVKSVFDEDIL